MRRQRSVLFRGPTSEGWGCLGRPDGMPQYGVAMTMVTPKMLNVWRHVDDVLISKLSVRVVMEDWGVDGTNKVMAGDTAATPHQRRRGRQRKRQRGGEGEVFRTDAEKGWKDGGQPEKDNGMDPQGGVGQEW